MPKRLALTSRYVGRVLECGFVAPDIVEAILDGRQPLDLTFRRLTRRLPLSWAAQREQLGFPPCTHGDRQSGKLGPDHKAVSGPSAMS